MAAKLPTGYFIIPLITPANTALGYTGNPAGAIYRIYSDDTDRQNSSAWDSNQLPFSDVSDEDANFSRIAVTLIAVTASNIDQNTGAVTLADHRIWYARR